MIRAEQLRRATHAAVFNIEPRRFIRLADDDMRNVSQAGTSRYAIGRLDAPYRDELRWGGARADCYRVDLGTGGGTLRIEGLRRQRGASPDGRWLACMQDGRRQADDIPNLKRVDPSPLAGMSFVDGTDDHDYELPSYGIAGWAKDGKAVIANHR